MTAVHTIAPGGPELGPTHTAEVFAPAGPADVVRGDGATLFPLSEGGPAVLVEDWLSDEEVLYVQGVWASAVADAPAGQEPSLEVSRVAGDLVVVVGYGPLTDMPIEATAGPLVNRPLMGTRRRR